MIKVPGFLLRRLYVKGSLKNDADGFQFQIKNSLGSGYAKKVFPLMLDGEELSLESTSFIQDGHEVLLSAVSTDIPFTLPMNKSIAMIVKGVTLSDGPHKIGMSFEVQGLGKLRFDFTDLVNDG